MNAVLERELSPGWGLRKFLIDDFANVIIARSGHLCQPDGSQDRRAIRDSLQENPHRNHSLMAMCRDLAVAQSGALMRLKNDTEVLNYVTRSAGMGNADLPALIESIFNKMIAHWR